MLNDRDIDKLLEPVINRQKNINNYILRKIAKRIAEIGEVLPSDVGQLERLYQIGADVKEINREIARLTGLQVAEIKRIIKAVAKDAYEGAKPYYDYRKKKFIPFEKNEPVQRMVKAVGEQTGETYKNISKAQAFMLRDKKNRKKFIPTPIAETYQDIVDEAIQATKSGVDYETAMRKSMKELAESDIRYVTYETESGRVFSQRLDTAVRRNLLDGMRAINQKVQEELGKELGMDGVEISVHENSAPDHEPIQGRQFSNEEYAKLNNQEPFESYKAEGQGKESFSAIKRGIGVLNCRHFAYSIILGAYKPMHTDKELQGFIDRNNEGYTFPDGRHFTMYQCTQYQRELETEIRKAKDKQIFYKTGMQEELALEEQAKVAKLLKQYKAFSDACGLSVKYPKLRVDGYKEIKK